MTDFASLKAFNFEIQDHHQSQGSLFLKQGELGE
jgi:hypothetical protein